MLPAILQSMKRGGTRYHAQPAEAVLESLDTSRDGLTPSQAAARLSDNGANILPHGQTSRPLFLLLRQLRQPVAILLLASAIVALVLEQLVVGSALLLLTLTNALLGFREEWQSARRISALESFSIPETTVIRAGLRQTISASHLVVGDMVSLQTGDAVPADVRIVTEHSFSTNDFALTGELAAVHKFSHRIDERTPLEKRHNIAYFGSYVTSGSAEAVVIATGSHTQLGQVAYASQAITSRPSHLQQEFAFVARRVTILTLGISAVVLIVSLMLGHPLSEAALLVIALIAALLPQGLPSQMTATLATAAGRLAKQQVLVRQLSAVETLGTTSLILSDKTGTLTTGDMAAQQVVVNKTSYSVTGEGYASDGLLLDAAHEPIGDSRIRELTLLWDAMTLCNNASIGQPDELQPARYAIGSPLEAALLGLAAKAGIDTGLTRRNHQELRQFPFDSTRKRMSSVRSYGANGKQYVFVKGAPDALLSVASTIWDHGHSRTLAPTDKSFITRQVTAAGKRGQHSIGLAYAVLPPKTKLDNLTFEDVERDLTWLGLVSLSDPLKDDTKAAVTMLHHAHIKTALMSGDGSHATLASAQQAGFNGAHAPLLITSHALQTMSDRELQTHLKSNATLLLSSLNAEDKQRVVAAAQAAGHTVAVTGDGINDVLALHQADIGIAMGRRGADVAKESASAVVLNDSFAAITRAIGESRTIIRNVRSILLASFTSNAAELTVLLLSFIAVIFWDVPIALAVMQILVIDLVAESLPLSMLGRDRDARGYMDQKPSAFTRQVFTRASVIDIIWSGLLIGGLAFTNYLLFFDRHGAPVSIVPSDSTVHLAAMSLTFLTLVLCQLANIIMRRSPNGFFSRTQLQNPLFWGAVIGSIIITTVIIYQPTLQQLFATSALTAVDWLWALAATGIFIIIRQFYLYDRLHHRAAIHALHTATKTTPAAAQRRP